MNIGLSEPVLFFSFAHMVVLQGGNGEEQHGDGHAWPVLGWSEGAGLAHHPAGPGRDILRHLRHHCPRRAHHQPR